MTSQSQSLATSLAQSLSTSLIKKSSLPFADGSFTNASPRYILTNGVMTGPFAGGTLATRVIGGKRFAQFESARTSMNKYSEQLQQTSPWARGFLDTVNANQDVGPLGNSTMEQLVENGVANVYRHVTQPITVVIGQRYIHSFFVRQGSGTARHCRIQGEDSANRSYFNPSTGAWGTTSGAHTTFVIDMGGGLYYAGIIFAATVVDGYESLGMTDADGDFSYDGDGSSNLYYGFANYINCEHLTSYIQTGATTATRAPDQFHWAEADVPAWVRTGLKARLIMHQGTDEMLAAGTQEPTLFAFDTTAKGEVKLYFDHADKKLKWLDNTGALGESAALNWSLDDVIDVEWNPDNGSNSTLKVDGGGVDTTYTGTQTAVADGNFYYGMDTSEANLANIFLISEPEPL